MEFESPLDAMKAVQSLQSFGVKAQFANAPQVLYTAHLPLHLACALVFPVMSQAVCLLYIVLALESRPNRKALPSLPPSPDYSATGAGSH